MTSLAAAIPLFASMASRNTRRGTSGAALGAGDERWPRPSLLEESEEVGAIAGFGEGGGAFAELVVGEEAAAPGDLFGGADLQSLAVLDGPDIVGCLDERVEGSGVEPGGAAGQDLDLQPSLVEVGAVDVGDLVLPAR